jgi:coenzyme F420-reducing hydrogenase gamma subunit
MADSDELVRDDRECQPHGARRTMSPLSHLADVVAVDHAVPGCP